MAVAPSTSFHDVCSLVNVIEDLGNPFEKESTDLLVLDNKDIADPAAVETVWNVRRIGQDQFKAFTRECLLERTKSIHDAIHCNKLKLFNSSTTKAASKGKQQLTSLKNDVELFSRLYIGRREMETSRSSFAMRIRHVLQHSPMAETSV